jgi:hypothetical protein
MANANTVAGFAGSGTLRNQFPTQTVATATETALLLNTDTGTTTCFVVVPTGGLVYGANTSLDANSNSAIIGHSSREYGLPSGQAVDQFSSKSWDGIPFKVRLSGIGNAGANAAQSLIVNLYQGTSTTLGSDKAIGTTGAAFAAVAGGAFNFYIEAKLLWDATSGILSGDYMANIAFGTVSQFTTTTVVTNVVTGVTASGLSFLASLKLGNAASSTITLREFSVEKV